MPPLLAAALLGGQGVIRPGEPIDWNSLPTLPYRSPLVITPEMTDYVAAEMQSGTCGKPVSENEHLIVRVDVAVLLAADATVRATIPRAIDCSTVEQYAAGVVSSFARNNLIVRGQSTAGWYRATVTFDWRE